MQVILQVLADVRRIDLTRDACSLKFRSRPDAGQQQQVRRPDGTTAQHHLLRGEGGTGFTTANTIFDAGGNPLTRRALQDYTRDLRARDDGEFGRFSVSPSRNAWYVLDRLPLRVEV